MAFLFQRGTFPIWHKERQEHVIKSRVWPVFSRSVLAEGQLKFQQNFIEQTIWSLSESIKTTEIGREYEGEVRFLLPRHFWTLVVLSCAFFSLRLLYLGSVHIRGLSRLSCGSSVVTLFFLDYMLKGVDLHLQDFFICRLTYVLDIN